MQISIKKVLTIAGFVFIILGIFIYFVEGDTGGLIVALGGASGVLYGYRKTDTNNDKIEGDES